MELPYFMVIKYLYILLPKNIFITPPPQKKISSAIVYVHKRNTMLDCNMHK